MAPTTLPGMKTTTTQNGRDVKVSGYPVRVCELLATLEGTRYLERVMITDPANINKAKKAIKKSFQTQLDGKGFSLVEVLSPCPVNWGKSPLDGLKFVKEEMTKYFKIGVIKDETIQ